ncbi:MAG TPA: DUF192 domain-containing protein [Allosphingosinicella sp.]|jgi:hypothetical protein
MLRFLFIAAALGALPACQAETEPSQNAAPPAAVNADAQSPGAAVSGLPLIPLEIRSGTKVHRFTVEVAATEDEQAYGLMNRTQLGPNEGMIFPMKPARPASFWMKNTLIPLDMLFIRPDGSIARIAANTVPESLDPVGVSEPVAAVLEIPGGRSAQLGITEAARVTWKGGPR